MDNPHRKAIEDILKTREDGTLIHRESQTLEFKESFNFSGIAEYYRDFAAFANNRGGYLVFGVKDKPRREKVGLNTKAKDQFDRLDPEKVEGHLLNHFTGHITWEQDVIEHDGQCFGYFYVAEANEKPIICKKDEGEFLRDADIYYRYGGRTQRIRYSELEAIIKHRIERQNAQWVDLVTKIGKTGPSNAAILDMDKGKLETEAQVLVVDEKLVERIKFIKEGEFDEKEGAPTLKLIGDVTPVNKVEVIRHERVNQLKEYPLTATELAKQVKERGRVKQNDIWRIIEENGIKDNKDYSCFIFRNKKQEDDYIQHGRVATCTPSIYKPSAVDLIIQIAKNEH